MPRHPYRFLFAALALGWLFDFLFWDHPFGIAFAAYTALVLAGGFFLLLPENRKPAPLSLLLLLPVTFFALVTVIRMEPLSLFLAHILTLFSLAVLAVTWLGGCWPHYQAFDYIGRFILLAVNAIAGPEALLRGLRQQRRQDGPAAPSLRIVPVIRGLLLALPVLFVFTALLASADLVFNRLLGDFFKLFDLGRLPEYFIRLVFILIAAFALAGVYLYAAFKSDDTPLAGERKPLIPPFIGLTESAVVLGSVDLLFLVFVIVQFQYFFGGNANIHVEGYTYSQYARRGFAELVLVAGFSLVMILGLSSLTRRETPTQRRIFSGLSLLLSALVAVILVSSFMRLNLVIDYYGFTRLRLYPLIFIVWLGLLLIAVVALEAANRQRFFTLAIVIAAYGFAASLILYNVDAAAVRHNVWRAGQGKTFDPAYLASLSTDAVPALVERFADPSLPAEIHEGIGAALVCHLNEDELYDHPAQEWRFFNLSRWQARRALDAVAPQLADYSFRPNNPVTYRNGPTVRTPDSSLYNCSVSDFLETID